MQVFRVKGSRLFNRYKSKWKVKMSIENLSQKLFDYDRYFFYEVEGKKRNNTYWALKRVRKNCDLFPYVEEHTHTEMEVSIWSGNDYLGMSSHPEVIWAVKNSLERHGAGSGGARCMTGNSPLHEELEREIADLHQKENALLFTSCYNANHSTLVTLGKRLPGVHVFSDAGNHASIVHGVLNSGAPKHIYHQYDVDHLRYLLEKFNPYVPKIVAFETVHSMDGTICPLKEYCDVSHKNGALTFVDEVHAVGLYGDQGAGIGEMESCLDKMDIITGTFGKAFGNFGGYVAGTANTIDMIRCHAAGFIYTTSLPPATLAGTLAAIKILRSEEGRQLRIDQQKKVKYMRKNLKDKGIPVIDCPSHMILIHVGNAALARHVTEDLLQKHKMYVQCVHHPVVAHGTERLRVTPTPHHTYEMIDNFVACIVAEWRDYELELQKITPTNSDSE